MKNKLIKRFLIMIAGVVALMLSVTSASAVTNSTSVVSPFWQSDGNLYTFVAVSHTSLQTMNSEVGIVVKAVTSTGGTFGATTSFTISQSTTSRIFIVATNHATINSLTVTAATDFFVTGTTNSTAGHLSFTPVASNPLSVATQTNDITMLSFWGSVVIPGTNTGFAMEFIGDTHDSVFGTASKDVRTFSGVN